jgi:hypothetical protein
MHIGQHQLHTVWDNARRDWVPGFDADDVPEAWTRLLRASQTPFKPGDWALVPTLADHDGTDDPQKLDGDHSRGSSDGRSHADRPADLTAFTARWSPLARLTPDGHLVLDLDRLSDGGG